MKSKNVSFSVPIAGFLVICMVGTVVGGDNCMTCQGQNLANEKFVAANVTCFAEVKDTLKLGPNSTPKDVKKAFGNSCYMACMWEKLGVVANGAVNTPAVTSYITSTYPASARAALIEGITNCAKTSGTGLVKTDNCKSYKPFGKCFRKAIRAACKVPGGAAASMAPPTPSGRRRRQAPMTQKPGGPSSSSEESDEN